MPNLLLARTNIYIMIEKIIALAIFIAVYYLAITRKVKIAYASLGGAGLLILFGIVSPQIAVFSTIKWDVLGIYWGFMMVSMIFTESKIPALIASKIVRHAKKEKYAILYLCAITAFLSSFMENVGTVLMVAPIAIELSKKLRSSLFPYLVSIAISANIVTTVTMIADPPALILAIQTGMKFFDFYWFQGRLSLGVITIFGVASALASLLVIFRRMDKKVSIKGEKIRVDYVPLAVFIAGVLALAFGPYFGLSPGPVGLAAGFASLIVGRKKAKSMIKDYDWNSFFFIMGIFVVIGSLEITGLLADFVNGVGGLGITSPAIMLAIIIWVSVAASSFMDNVPYTVLMIPVCNQLAALMGINPFPLLFGMLIGTGMGGNITPVGATANVFACGMLEKRGYKIKLKDYLKISLPFSISAVIVCHILLQVLWL
jgi:Na+/H+ antiporter NhaD/arsenite permease-like protein